MSDNILKLEGCLDLPLRRDDFYDLKDYKRFIKKCETLIRSCPEYTTWRNYLVQNMGLDHCMFTNENIEHLKIDLHHHPLTLYDIVSIVLDNYTSTNKEFCSLDIVTEVLNLHYNNTVGYVLLIKSLHEKYHNGFLDIPIDIVLGDWRKILDTYVINVDTLRKVKEKTSITLNTINGAINKHSGWGNGQYPLYQNINKPTELQKAS